MHCAFTAVELARAAGFYVTRTDKLGGARVVADGLVLELGPDATDDQILRVAAARLVRELDKARDPGLRAVRHALAHGRKIAPAPS